MNAGAPSVIGLLERAERHVAAGQFSQARQTAATLRELALGAVDAGVVRDVVQRCLVVCRSLFGAARSGVAMMFAAFADRTAHEAGDELLIQRTLTACGLLQADLGNLAAAIDTHQLALDLACKRGSVDDISRAWNNIGACFMASGNIELAARCFQRSLNAVRGIGEPIHCRFAALGNLALCHFHLGRHDEGLEAGERALLEATPEVVQADPHGLLLTHRNLVRLHLARRNASGASRHLAQVRILANSLGSVRATIALSTANGAFELAQGNVDIGLTRLAAALAESRKLPLLLRDTLAFVAWSEDCAGIQDNLRRYRQELADHIFDDALGKVRLNVELAGDLGHTPVGRFRLARQVPCGPASIEQPGEWGVLSELAQAADLRIDDTGRHGRRVGALTRGLALEIGVNPIEAVEYGLAAQLHDIGMLSVPEHVSRQPGAISTDERTLINRHCDAGARMLEITGHARWGIARDMAQYHHAGWNGGGYPQGVRGVGIPLGARLCAVADAYDSMITARPWREPMTFDTALTELRRCAGTQLDPDLVRRFDDMLRRESSEIGIDPELDSGLAGFEAIVQSLAAPRGAP